MMSVPLSGDQLRLCGANKRSGEAGDKESSGSVGGNVGMWR